MWLVFIRSRIQRVSKCNNNTKVCHHSLSTGYELFKPVCKTFRVDVSTVSPVDTYPLKSLQIDIVVAYFIDINKVYKYLVTRLRTLISSVIVWSTWFWFKKVLYIIITSILVLHRTYWWRRAWDLAGVILWSCSFLHKINSFNIVSENPIIDNSGRIYDTVLDTY